jgi:LexA DNA binding domain
MDVRPGELRDNQVRAARLTRGALVRRPGGDRALPPLTDRQAEVLGKLRAYRVLTGEDMPVRVLARSFAMTLEGARHHLDALTRKGYYPQS